MSLKQHLAKALPAGKTFEVYHFQSLPRAINGFVNRNSQDYQHAQVVKIQNFLSIAFNERIFFAIEIDTYIIMNTSTGALERHIFIAKADTNGYSDTKVKTGEVVSCFLKYLLSINCQSYLQKIVPLHRDYGQKGTAGMISKRTSTSKALTILSQRRCGHSAQAPTNFATFYQSFDIGKKIGHRKTESDGILTKISLFTRPERQYLFSESYLNPRKHLLTGSQLLRWWLDIVNKVSMETLELLNGRLQIPGENETTIQKQYLASLNKSNNVWRVGSIYGDRRENVHSIPLFPDDPKTRFIKDLIGESRYMALNLDQFWKELQARQEFRLDVLVGVVGIVGLSKRADHWPQKEDVYVPLSLGKFKAMKSYVVGEEYNTVEGAVDARSNLHQYYCSKLGQSPLLVVGELDYAETRTKNSPAAVQKAAVNVLSDFAVRKKAK
ncbi:hypothetical protein ACO0RG_000729 [Hanseniaspora osmophila]